MKIDIRNYCVDTHKKIDLDQWPTRPDHPVESKREYNKILHKHISQLNDLQQVFYASNRHALLLIFQGMDAAGKDGAIRHVMSGINPEGCDVTSFKVPSAEELQHDFLWRTTCKLPPRGRIGIFNRSYYEEVLIVRVHPELLRGEGLSAELRDDKHFWKDRYRSIVDYESYLDRNGTRIVKIFLHISSEEQRKRFLARIDTPDKNWKLSSSDVHERKYWKDYQTAYGRCIEATSTQHAPWYIVPADDKDTARLIVSRIVLDAMDAMKSSYPKAGHKRHLELEEIQQQLMS